MRSLTSFPGQRTVGTNADWIQRNQIMWLRRAVARFDFTQHDVCVDVHRPCNRTSVHLFSARSCTQYGPIVNTRHGGSRSDDDPSKSPIDRAEIASRLVTPLTVLNSLQKKIAVLHCQGYSSHKRIWKSKIILRVFLLPHVERLVRGIRRFVRPLVYWIVPLVPASSFEYSCPILLHAQYDAEILVSANTAPRMYQSRT